MSSARRKPQSRRRQSPSRSRSTCGARCPSSPPPEPIVPASRPDRAVASLGDPPLPGQGAVAGHYLAAVVERAAGLATALAAAAGMLAEPEEEP